MVEPDAAPRDRVALLEPGLADQIAAGEVVERPASIVKELVENAVDAGATQVDVDLVAGGAELVRVRDDGGGIHPEDLLLALTRHATSKLRRADELVEIHTLGFRGEALASIAAVARITLRSRRRDDELGRQLVITPDGAARGGASLAPRIDVVGMPRGTQIEVEHLFSNVPARRKFLRASATEVGHCIDALLRVALASPRVGFRLQHEGRTLVDLPAGALGERASSILSRVADGPFHAIVGERDGVTVEAWVAEPGRVRTARGGLHLMVRRRVIRDRTLAQIVARAVVGDDRELGVAAVVVLEPPRGTVDVNVHPQKAEVRFASPQGVFAALREVLGHGIATAPWRVGQVVAPTGSVGLSSHDERGRASAPHVANEPTHASLRGGRERLSPTAILDRAAAMPAEGTAPSWSRGAGSERSGDGGHGGASSGGPPTYRLKTRATTLDYAQVREAWLRDDSRPWSADAPRGPLPRELDRRSADARDPAAHERDRVGAQATHGNELPPGYAPEELPGTSGGDVRLAEELPDAGTLSTATMTANASAAEPAMLTTMSSRSGGPLGIFEHAGELLVVDLPKIRAWLVEQQLRDELGGEGIAVQALLVPVVLPRARAVVSAVAEAREDFTRLGVIVEPFDEGSLVVRGVPAHLREVVEEREVGDLVDRLLDWFELQRRGGASEEDAVRRLARVGARSASPRLARRWLRDVIARVGSDPAELARVDGIRAWSADELARRR